MTGAIYHLLRSAFGQQIPVAQIVNLDILDVVSICDVDIVVEFVRGLATGRRS